MAERNQSNAKRPRDRHDRFVPDTTPVANVDGLAISTPFPWTATQAALPEEGLVHVTVSGSLGIDPTVAATLTSFLLALPVPATLGLVTELWGFCVQVGATGIVTANVATDEALVSLTPPLAGVVTTYVQFSYLVPPPAL